MTKKTKFGSKQLISLTLIALGLLIVLGSGFLGSVFIPEEERSGEVLVLNADAGLDSLGNPVNRQLVLHYFLTDKEFGPNVPVKIPFYYNIEARNCKGSCLTDFTISNALLNGTSNKALLGFQLNNITVDSQALETSGLVNYDSFSQNSNSCNTSNQNVSPENRFANDYCRQINIDLSNSELENLKGRDWGSFEGKLTLDLDTAQQLPSHVSSGFVNETPFELRFKFFKQSDLCVPTPGYTFAEKKFTAGEVVSLNSFPNSFQALCWGTTENPYYYADLLEADTNNLISSSNDVYEFIQDGGSYTVPANDVLVVKYISTPTSNVFSCDPDEYEVSGECVSIPAFQDDCNGIWDPVTSSCLTQPIKPDQGTFNVETGQSCIVLAPDSVSTVVPEGSSLTELDSGQLLFCFTPRDFCSDASVPFTTDSGETVCSEYQGGSFDNTPFGGIVNNQFLGYILIILGLVLFIIWRK